MFDKIVVVTRETRLEGLVERFNSRGQAKFYIEHAGGDFSEYVKEHDAYHASVDRVRRSLELGIKLQLVPRRLVPTFLFTEKDLVVTVGQDGLVANTAKYALGIPLVAVNPDPERFDGILLPFSPNDAAPAVRTVLEGKAKVREVTLAEARFNDGQRLLAFNELFVGVGSSHVSARYRVRARGREESQSSSGVLVATGAGSTGWLSSVFNMAAGVASFLGATVQPRPALAWEDPRLVYVVREPFKSKHSSAGIVAGTVEPGDEIVFESLMPSGGVVFSDGIEADYLAFNSGATAHVRAAAQHAKLVVR